MNDSQEYRIISLTKGQVAIVDAVDYAWLSGFKWCARWDARTQSFYALRQEGRRHEQRSIYMHREILGLAYGDPRHGDHKESGKTLDNRRNNLRIATPQQNVWNSRLSDASVAKSGFRGVRFCTHGGSLVRPWNAYIYHNNRQ